MSTAGLTAASRDRRSRASVLRPLRAAGAGSDRSSGPRRRISTAVSSKKDSRPHFSLHVVLRGPLVLVADEFDQLIAGAEAVIHTDRPGLGVRLRVLDREIGLEPAVTRTADALGQFESAGIRCAAHVQPAIVAESRRLDHEGVAVPAAHGVALP